MEQTGDVERLFSWLKTEDIRYREFAAAREVSDAVGTWPALHRVASESGRAADTAAPEGSAAAKARILQEQKEMPPVAAEAIRTGAPSAMPPPPLAGGRLMSALGRRMQSVGHGMAAAAPGPLSEDAAGGFAARSAGGAEPGGFEDAAARERAREAAERLRERLDAAMAVNPRPTAPAEGGGEPSSYEPPDRPEVGVTRAASPAGRGGLFGGAYRRRDDVARDETRSGGGRGHSLQAVFSRLSSSGGRGLPDPRERGRSAPGLRTVFGRLR